jgi:two-component system nitrate/nitrite response regulator NarL
MVSVAIIEDHQVFVDALSMYLQRNPEFRLIGSAGTFAEGSELIQGRSPEIVLLDVGLPDRNGMDLIPEIRRHSPKTKIIVLTSFSDESTLMRAIDSGVSGFVQKGSSLSELLTAMRDVAEGEIVMPVSILIGLSKKVTRDQASTYHSVNGWEPLTDREKEVLLLLSRGCTGKAIAAELYISPLTVRTHVRNLLSKLGVHSRLEAVSFGLRNGLIEPPG